MKKVIRLNLVSLLLFFGLRLWQHYVLLKSPEFGGFIISKVLAWSVQINTNLAFGLPWSNAVAIGLMLMVLVILVAWWWQSFFRQAAALNFFISLVLVGAFSNLLDRWRLGGVLDYWSLLGISVFNLADVLIVVGIILILIQSVWQPKFFRSQLLV